jgi:hypothetical protein
MFVSNREGGFFPNMGNRVTHIEQKNYYNSIKTLEDMRKIKEKEWNHQSKKFRIIKEKEEKRANKNEEFFFETSNFNIVFVIQLIWTHFLKLHNNP